MRTRLTMIRRAVFAAVILGTTLGCAGAPDRNADAEAAAAAARGGFAALDGGTGTGTGGTTTAASTPAAPAAAADAGVLTGAKPAWVDGSPYAVFPEARYVAAVGYGSRRDAAERSALANLTAVFGQSVQAEIDSVTSYTEAVRNGRVTISTDTNLTNRIVTNAAMDALLGAEIGGVWRGGEGVYYAAAVLDRAVAASLYGDLIRSNERFIAGLLDMRPAEKNSIDGYKNYLLAAATADASRLYANVLTKVGGRPDVDPGAMKDGSEYRLAAREILKTIPVAVDVTGDPSGRVAAALTAALAAEGFRGGVAVTRYALRGAFTLEPVDMPAQQNKFVRYALTARLVDTVTGTELLPYTANGREGHVTLPEAEERALKAAEKKIPTDFGERLRKYLER